MSTNLRYSLTFPSEGRCMVLLMRSVTAFNPFRKADAKIEKMSTYVRYSLTFPYIRRWVVFLVRSGTGLNPFRRAEGEIEKCLHI